MLEKCIHFVSSKSPWLRLLVLDTIEAGIQALSQSENQLLPMIHRLWPAMVKRFTDSEQVRINIEWTTSKELNPVFWKPIKVSLNPWPFQASVVCTNGTFMTPPLSCQKLFLCVERKDLEYKNGVYTRKEFSHVPRHKSSHICKLDNSRSYRS